MQDTQWNDIDYMYKHLDWTYDTSKYNGLPDVVADLHQHGQHYIMIIVSLLVVREELDFNESEYGKVSLYELRCDVNKSKKDMENTFIVMWFNIFLCP
jgi:alpha-glucosidase (family GH31 glycosyl hydrolase)